MIEISAYRELLQAMIKREIQIVGKVAIRVAEDTGRVKLDDKGNLIEVKGDEKEAFLKIYNEYKKMGFGLATTIIKHAIQPVLEKYGDVDIPDELKK